MRATAVIVALSGWAVAAWLFLGRDERPRSSAEAPEMSAAVDHPRPADLSPEGFAKEDGIQPHLEPPLATAFREWSSEPALAGALVGFCLLDEMGGIVFASPLAETALCPASSLKTLTTAAALELLTPDFRFETKLASAKPIGSDGVLGGDLVLTGGGDPTLSSADLEALAGELVKAGLKQVTGKLKVDATVFSAPPVSDHWNWGDIGNAYGAGAFGVNVDHNRLLIRFEPGAKAGEQVRLLDSMPVLKGVRWNNQVATGPARSGDQVMVYSEPAGDTITLHGTVPAGESGFAVSGAVPDPPALAAEVLQAALEKSGVRFLGRELPDRAAGVALAVHRSGTLPEIIDHLHKVSDNLEAQCLFLTMGRLKQDDPVNVLPRHWETRGVSFTGLRLIDGSGLARANMIRPLDLAKVNHLARTGPHGDRFRQSLTAYLDGKVRSKLGAMSGVKTEVGFLTTEGGRELTFALMANGLALNVDFWPLREKLLREVASESAR